MFSNKFLCESKFATFSIVLCAAILLNACNSTTTGSNANTVASGPSTGSTGNTPVPQPTVGGPPSAVSLYVTPLFDMSASSSASSGSATLVPYFLHEQSSFTQKCQVLAGETNATKLDIYCILDMAELDLYHRQISFNYNVPPTMCQYFRVTPYWFYDYEPSHGYLQINAAVTVTDGVASAPVYTDMGGAPLSPSPVTINASGTVTSCKYNYSTNGNSGPNCCEGVVNSTVTTITHTTDPSTSVTTTTTSLSTSINSLGGNVASCAVGPGVDYAVGPGGFPIPRDIYVATIGVNDALTLAVPSVKNLGTNLYVSNYFKPTAFGNASDVFPYTSTNLPTAILGPNTGGVPNGHAYYEFACLDRADDYIARIRVLVRSWDTMAGFTAQSNPYTSGNDPVFGFPWHDVGVWMDVGSVYPGALL